MTCDVTHRSNEAELKQKHETHIYLQGQRTGRPSWPVLMETLDPPGTSPVKTPGRRLRTEFSWSRLLVNDNVTATLLLFLWDPELDRLCICKCEDLFDFQV